MKLHLMILSLYHYRDYPPWPGQPPSSNDRDNLHSLVLPRVRSQTHRRAGQEGNFLPHSCKNEIAEVILKISR